MYGDAGLMIEKCLCERPAYTAGEVRMECGWNMDKMDEMRMGYGKMDEMRVEC